MPAPDLNSVPSFYHKYIRLLQGSSLSEAMEEHLSSLCSLLEKCTEENWNYAYAPGKWTLKELVQHVIDAERIFSHRALSIARLDPHPLPGFDEDLYALQSAAVARSGSAISEEVRAVKNSTRCLFGSFDAHQLAASGIANGAPVSVEAIAYILLGHGLHHTNIIRERYFPGM